MVRWAINAATLRRLFSRESPGRSKFVPLEHANRYRSHTCGELRASDEKCSVNLSGWVARRRDMGGVIFIDLRDREGITQVVFDPQRSGAELHRQADRLRSEWVIRVAGNVKRRPAEMANPKLGTGEIEVEVSELEVLSEARTPPFELNERSAAGEDVRLKYRFLDLRRAEMQRNLRIRHNAIQAVRAFLHEKGFWDVETPLLGKSTPEGARDYLVPSRVNPGTFYALPQSPQLYKQLLMVAGFDKYCQIPRCLRDEDLRADRQPEFTQLDLEMSFVGQEDVFRVIEGAMKALFQGGLGLDIPTPFPRITHAEAMSKYGSDKPDLRFKEELVDLTEFSKTCGFKVFQEAAAKGGLVKGFNAKGWGAKKGRAEIDRLGERVKDFRAKGLAWFRVENGDLNSNLTKFFSPEQRAELKTLFAAADGDLLLFAAGEPGIVNPTLSFLRNLWGAASPCDSK
jgi:aspartyl-tRNA synthetase